MEKDIFYLDWKTQELLGWEDNKSDLVIDSIIRGIEAGDDFPPVSVYKDIKNPDRFYISPFKEIPSMFADGGHNRAVAHYIADKPLKCKLNEGVAPLAYTVCIVPIPDIIIEDDLGDYKKRKQRYPDYR